MEHNLQLTIALLTRTPAALDGLLLGLPPEWTKANEGGDTWNAHQIIGHLIYCERFNWMVRSKAILEHGETRPFEPFDRQRHKQELEGMTMEQLLDEFARVRAENLVELRSWNLQPADFAKRGIHPTFGSVTLDQQLATWAAHDLNHLHQLSRVLAHQYREAVGPWTRFLGVMHCDGHSEP